MKKINKYSFFLILLMVFSSESSYSQDIPGIVDFETNEINFGNIEQGSDAVVIQNKVTNVSNRMITIQGETFRGQFGALFGYRNLSSTLSKVRLNPNESLIFEILFPVRTGSIGPKSTSFSFNINDNNRTIIANLIIRGNIVPKFHDTIYNFGFSIPNMEYNIGDTFDIPIIVDNFTKTDSAKSISATFTFNKTLIALTKKEDVGVLGALNHTKVVTNLPLSQNEYKKGDTIYKLRAIAVAGNNVKTSITLDSITLHSQSGSVKRFVITKSNGSLKLKDVFYDGDKPRLFQQSALNSKFLLNGNVFNSDIISKVGYKGKGLLRIYNLDGDLKQELILDNNTDYTEKEFLIGLNLFPLKGVYILSFLNSTDCISRIVLIEK